MRLPYEISKMAQRDLEEIWEYTYEKWSKSKADQYYRNLIREFDKICKYPEIGWSIDYVKTGYRTLRIKSHLILYKIIEDKIFIDRVLHERMDIENRAED